MLAGGAGLVDVPHVRLVLGARPRADAARWSRSSPRCCCCSACAGCRSACRTAGRWAGARARAAAQRCATRDRRRRRRRPRRARLRRDDAAAARHGVALLPRARLYRRRRHQRGQRDPRRFPRLRHAGRDHRARRRSRSPSTRCCAASARRPRAWSRRRSSRRKALRAAADDLLVPRRAHARHVPADLRCSRSTCCCAATTCRAAASSPASRRDRPSSCSTWPAARAGSRTARAPAGALDRRRPAARGRDGRGRVAVRASVPHLARRARRRCRCSARCTCRARSSSTSASSSLVVGATVLMLIALAHQSLRARRGGATWRRSA